MLNEASFNQPEFVAEGFFQKKSSREVLPPNLVLTPSINVGRFNLKGNGGGENTGS